MKKILDDLKELSEEKIKVFMSSLVPNRDKETFLGVRNPVLREYSKKISDDDAHKFMEELPHRYYEENLLHRYLIEKMKDYDKVIVELNRLLPYLNSWGETDSFKSKTFIKHKDDVFKEVKKWLKSDHEYTIRFGLNILQSYFLDDLDESLLDLVANIDAQNRYYIEMMQAWFYSTAMMKNFDLTVGFLKKADLTNFVYNKAIQKAIESFRITDEQKVYLRTLRRK